MPLSPQEAFGLFSTAVQNEGHKMEMLRLGLMGFQQTLQENERYRQENEALKAQLKQAGLTPQTPPSPQGTVPFPGGQRPPDAPPLPPAGPPPAGSQA